MLFRHHTGTSSMSVGSSSPLPVLLTRLDAGLLPCARAAQKRLRRTVAASLCRSILHA
jgi:hypothetical protein